MEAFLPKVVDDYIAGSIELLYSYAPLAEKTVILVPGFVTTYMESLSEAIGFDMETLSYVMGLFVCYPLGMIMASLPYGKVKHFFSFILGAFLLQFTIGKQWIHHAISVVFSYIMFLILPKSLSKVVVPTFIMLYVTLGHLHRQYVNYLGWDLDFTGSHMVLTMKLYSMAFNLFDGEMLKKGKDVSRATKKCSDVALDEVPGFIEFLGYTFNFSSILAGPAMEFKYYKDACDGINLYDKNGNPKGKIPSQIIPTLKPFLISLICMGLFVVGGGMFPLLDPNDPQNATPAIISEEMLKKSFFGRFAYIYLALFFVRQKYYFAWKNAEGASNIWYGGFEGFDQDGNLKGWSLSSNVDILTFEFGSNVKTVTGGWNKKTANWLGRYVYMRTGGSLLITYGMSAFWHGFYPGYYLFFMSVPLLTACERLGRKKISPHFSSKSLSLYSVFCTIVTNLGVNYFVIAFQLLAYDWAVTGYKSLYFFGHIGCVIFYALVSQLPTPKKKTL